MARKLNKRAKPTESGAKRGTDKNQQMDHAQPAQSALNNITPTSKNWIYGFGMPVGLAEKQDSSSATPDEPVTSKKTARGTKKKNNGSLQSSNPKRRCIETSDEQEEKENLSTVDNNAAKFTLYARAKYWLPRNIPIPIGLTHTPLHMKLPFDKFGHVISKLTILPLNGSPESVKEGLEYRRLGGRGLSSRSPPAAIQAYIGSKPDEKYMDEDREELMWSAERFGEHLEHQGKITEEESFYKAIKNKYLFTIWRQFQGRIPQEMALRNLMENGYDIAKALDTIDECLKILPQKLIAPSIAQVQVLQQEIKKYGDKISLGKLQNSIMKNYHISEVFNYYLHFGRFFNFDDDADLDDGLNLKITCNCLEAMCRHLDYEPRYSCSNCTKALRTRPLPTDQLCLICSTYKDITGVNRPAQNVAFDEDDIEKIKLWDAKFKKTDQKEFEKWLQKRKNRGYKALKLTQEEALMLNFEKLDLKDDDTPLGVQVQSMLQPYVLPHFSHCQCQHSGGIPIGSPNFGKTDFSEEEQQAFVAAITQTPRDIKTAAASLAVEEELVEVFLKKHKAGSAVWKDLGRVKVHSYPARKVLPPINPPPVIPRL